MVFRYRIPIVIGALMFTGMLSLSGCKSSRSTFLLRDETNSFWEKKRANGIPMTLKVPTHVKLYIYETHYLEAVEVGGVSRVQYVELPVVLRDFGQEFIKTEKVVMVDFKRPAAGTFNLSLDLDDQYIDTVKQDITDETLSEVNAMLSTIVGGFPQGFNPQSEGGSRVDVKEVKSVVAVGVFEIDAPDFEVNVMQFLNCHLNQSHDAWAVPPGVAPVRRPPVDGDASLRPPLCPDGQCYPGFHVEAAVPTVYYGSCPAPSGPAEISPSLPTLAPHSSSGNYEVAPQHLSVPEAIHLQE